MRYILTILLLLFCSDVFAQSVVDRVTLEPLSGGISFNTITFGERSTTGWVTANTVKGRKEIMIINTSTTGNLYVTGVSGSTAIGTIFPREDATFLVSSSLNIYVSANTVLSCEVWEVR